MSKRPSPSLPELAIDSWLLASEACAVIWLRGLRLALGGRQAEREAVRMVSEKVTAGITLWPVLLSPSAGFSPEETSARVLEHFSKPVEANRRRLSRVR